MKTTRQQGFVSILSRTIFFQTLLNIYSRQAFVLLCFITIISQNGYSQLQTIEQHEGIRAIAENHYGANDILYNGKLYYPLHPMANGSPYFKDHNWSEGWVKIGEEVFDQLELKFDLESQQLVFNAKPSGQGGVKIILDSMFIDEFYISGHHFIHSRILKNDLFKQGYYELIYQGAFTFLKQHSVSFQNVYNDFNPYGKYAETTSTKLILINNQRVKVNRKRSFLELFGSHKKEIKRFMRKNKIRYKKCSNDQLVQLLEFCNNLNPNKTN